MGVNFKHLRVLFIKNLWLQLRSPLWIILETLLPIGLVVLYCVIPKYEIHEIDRPIDFSQARLLPETMRNRSIAVAYTLKKNCCSKEGIDWFNANFGDRIRLEEFKSFEEMRKDLLSWETGSRHIFGLEIEKLDTSKREFHYKILVNEEVIVKKETDMNWGDIVKVYKQKNTKNDVYNVQFMLENAFVMETGVGSLNVAMANLPTGERIESSFFLKAFFSLMPGMLLLSVVANTRNLVVERNTIHPYLSVMGLTRTVFYISHCLVLFIKVLIFVILMGTVAFWGFPNFPWGIAIPVLILFAFATTAFSAMMATFFTSPATAMQLCISAWLSMAITPQVYPPDLNYNTYMASLTSIWPTYALHYIVHYMMTCSDIGEEMNCYTGVVDPKWTNQAVLAPILILFVDTIGMIVISVIMETGFVGKVFNFFRKKFRKGGSKKAAQVELLSDADESFEMDETNADICLDDVFKEYENGEKAVNGLNLKAHRGQVTVLLGHNGAGKTTTFSMICGVEKATAGSVKICGHKAGSLESRRMIGYCAQANTLIDQMTVKDHLWLLHGLKQGEGHYWDEGKELVEQLGLQDHVNKKVSGLSGGQKRKLCVCMALIGGSRVILLDEPTAGMDPESRRDVETMLEEVKKDRTVLLTTHYMDEAETLGDRIFIVAAGQTVCSGSPQFLKKRFGTGYVLTLVADESRDSTVFAKELTSVVKTFAPSARLGEVRGKQVEIAIPVKEQKRFPDLFRRLETDQESLSISSFGLSLNSLEQVFLRVTNLTDEKATVVRETPLEEALDSLYKEERRRGFRLYLSQIWAMLVKKGIYSIRFWSQLVTQIGLPLSSIFFGLTMYTLVGDPQIHYPILLNDTEDGVLVRSRWNSTEMLAETFSNVLGEKARKLDSWMPLRRFEREHHGQHYFFGAIFGESGMKGMEGFRNGLDPVTLLPNPEFPLSYASAINALNNARLNSASGIKGSISVSFETYSSLDSKFATNLGLLVILLETIMMCQFIVTTVEDQASSFAHQQILMGLPPFIYWTGDFLYSLVLYLLMIGVYTISAMFTDIIALGYIAPMVCMIMLYYWAVIPSVFILSKWIKSSSRAALIHWILLFGSFGILMLGPPLLTEYLGVELDLEKWNPIEMNAWEWGNLVLALLFPTIAMFRLSIVFIKIAHYDAAESVLRHLWAQLGLHASCLFVTGTATLVLFLLMQQRHIRYMVAMATRIKWARKYVAEEKITIEVTSSNSQEGDVMLETDDLCKVYGKNCALAHLNMAVQEKECFGLLGVSGAGKTTAFNIITGQMFATQGKAVVDGTDCKGNLVLGFCPQFDAIHKDFTGKQALTILARIHGYRNPSKIADQVIAIVGMQEHAKKRMYRCSGGQRRRISVAASLLPRNSRIIILDEATAGIDPKARRDIWEVLAAVREHSAILMTSHSMDECEALCSRIGILKHGGLAAVGTSQTLKSKYGHFFTLTMALPSSKMRSAVASAVAEWFPGSILKSDGFSLHLKWQVPKKPDDCWSSLFASCIELSEKIGVPDFCLTQSTLQDIFLLLAGENKATKINTESKKSSSSSNHQ